VGSRKEGRLGGWKERRKGKGLGDEQENLRNLKTKDGKSCLPQPALAVIEMVSAGIRGVEETRRCGRVTRSNYVE